MVRFISHRWLQDLGVVMQVIDRWTTQHGSWDVNPANKYGIDKQHADKYFQGSAIPGAGADHHIFVCAFAGNVVTFKTSDNTQHKDEYLPLSGWVNFPIFEGYKASEGERGPWQVWVEGEMVADGIGLPDGEHVSTFLVMGKGDKPDVPQPPAKQITVIIDDVVYTNFKRFE